MGVRRLLALKEARTPRPYLILRDGRSKSPFFLGTENEQLPALELTDLVEG